MFFSFEVRNFFFQLAGELYINRIEFLQLFVCEISFAQFCIGLAETVIRIAVVRLNASSTLQIGDRFFKLGASQIRVADAVKSFGEIRIETGGSDQGRKGFTVTAHRVVEIAEVILSISVIRSQSGLLLVSG